MKCRRAEVAQSVLRLGCGLIGRLGIGVLFLAKMFPSQRVPDLFWSPPSPLSCGFRRSFPRRSKAPEREADHSPPTGTKVKNKWIYISTVTVPNFMQSIIRKTYRNEKYCWT
jgi:hypothetical protein